MSTSTSYPFFFFFNDTATTEIYTLSLHDALPIWLRAPSRAPVGAARALSLASGGDAYWDLLIRALGRPDSRDRKSTRLNSSHLVISYAVFCLKKKKKTKNRGFSSTSNYLT